MHLILLIRLSLATKVLTLGVIPVPAPPYADACSEPDSEGETEEDVTSDDADDEM